MFIRISDEDAETQGSRFMRGENRKSFVLNG